MVYLETMAIFTAAYSACDDGDGAYGQSSSGTSSAKRWYDEDAGRKSWMCERRKTSATRVSVPERAPRRA
jgi:hypothetical protein